MNKLNDLTGQRFGTWTVIERAPITGRTYWVCRCDCGTIKNVLATTLKNGTSTGCQKCIWKTKDHPRLHKDGSRRWINGKATHIYSEWRGIKERCNNPKNKSYKNYGGRGIKLCSEWDKDFQSWFDYVSKLEHFGEPGRTLDRINNDDGYKPGNVRWATKIEQEHNKRPRKKRRKTTVGSDNSD